ncbi:MAG: hypothetical protein ACLP07_06695 [Terracidiphilus sp.]
MVTGVQSTKRPITITILSWLYIAIGVLSTAAHYANFSSHKPMVNEFVWITALGAAAILAGAFMLHGQNWARWLGLVWMATHVVISALHLMHGFLIHSVLLVLIAYFLFRREAREYFSAG